MDLVFTSESSSSKGMSKKGCILRNENAITGFKFIQENRNPTKKRISKWLHCIKGRAFCQKLIAVTSNRK